VNGILGGGPGTLGCRGGGCVLGGGAAGVVATGEDGGGPHSMGDGLLHGGVGNGGGGGGLSRDTVGSLTAMDSQIRATTAGAEESKNVEACRACMSI
jgi:hypothetical protein